MLKFREILVVLISVCSLAGCGTRQSDAIISSNTSNHDITSSEAASSSKEEAINTIISSIDDAIAENKPFSDDEAQALLKGFGQAIQSKNQATIDEAFFGKGIKPHSYEMGLIYPFADVTGFSCKTLETSLDEDATPVITLDVLSAGKTGLKEGEGKYALSFALGNDSAYGRGSVKMMLPYEKNISQDSVMVSIINKFRSYVTTDVFASPSELSSTALTAFLFTVNSSDDMTMTGEELAKTAKTYLGLDEFAPHKDSNFSMIGYDKERNIYSMPAIDGNYTSSCGVRAISHNELEDGIYTVTYEGYEDGLFITPSYKLTYTLEKTKAADGSEAYTILSCK